jgi:hypothetical protein
MEPTPESSSGATTLELLLQNPKNPEAWERFVQRYSPIIYHWGCQQGLQEADARDVT